MAAFRQLLLGHRFVAALALLMALAVRLAVPVGFMPAATGSRVAIVACPAAEAVRAAMPGMHHGHDAPAKGATDCPFAGLSLPSLDGGDAARIEARVVATAAVAIRPAAVMPSRWIAHLRPPLRGPPARG